MKLFTSYIRELFARYILKKLNTINTSNGREVKYDLERPVFSFSRHIKSIVSNACSRRSRSTIQKIIEKSTCKSRLTVKQYLYGYLVNFKSSEVVRSIWRKANKKTCKWRVTFCNWLAQTCNSPLTGKRTLNSNVGFWSLADAWRFHDKLSMTVGAGLIIGGISPIQKNIEKTTCNSRVTGKCTLNSDVGFLNLTDAGRFLRSASVISPSSVETTRGKSLGSYVLCLATIKILFCVCLAHARRRGLGTPAATGVALKTVPFLQIKRRNQGKNRRDAKKLRRNAITSKLSTLSISFATILFCVCLAHARQQGLGTPVATGVALSTDSINPLQIGDSIPSALWNLPLQMIKAGQEGTTTVTLNDYKGKLIILDFWATWCASCIVSLPKLHDIQNSLKDNLVLIPVSAQNDETVNAFIKQGTSKYVNQIKHNFSTIVSDRALNKFFPHATIPHTVIIDKDGQIVKFTYPEYLTLESLAGLSKGEDKTYIPVKRERKLAKPLLTASYADVLVHGNTYYTTLTGFTDGFDGHSEVLNDTIKNQMRLYAKNRSILQLYLQCYVPRDFNFSFANRRILLSHSPWKYDYLDEQGGNRVFDLNWKKQHTYCYEAILPGHLGIPYLYRRMRDDLDAFLGLKTRIEKRPTKVWILKKATGSRDRGKQINASDLVYMLNNRKNNPVPFVLDHSDSKGKTNLSLPEGQLSINDINKILIGYGLCVEEDEILLDMFILEEIDAHYENGAPGNLILTDFGYIPAGNK